MGRWCAGKKQEEKGISSLYFFLSWKIYRSSLYQHGSVRRAYSLGTVDGVIIGIRSHTIVREAEKINIWKES